MRDQVSILRVETLHPKIRAEVKALIEATEAKFPPAIAVRIVQALRTIEEQDDLYSQGRTKPGQIVTKARGGLSYHNYGLAIDFALIHDKDGNGSFEELSWDKNLDFDKDGMEDWKEVVDTFKAAGYAWGGDFKSIPDAPHLEKSFGLSVRVLLDKYRAGSFIPGTKYVFI